MRNAQAIIIASPVATPVAWRRYPRVEKTSESGTLDGKQRDKSDDRASVRAGMVRAKSSRNETAFDSQDLHASRLVSGFVAQLIAQVTDSGVPDAASGLSAYGNGNRRAIAFLCDRSA